MAEKNIKSNFTLSLLQFQATTIVRVEAPRAKSYDITLGRAKADGTTSSPSKECYRWHIFTKEELTAAAAASPNASAVLVCEGCDGESSTTRSVPTPNGDAATACDAVCTDSNDKGKFNTDGAQREGGGAPASGGELTPACARGLNQTQRQGFPPCSVVVREGLDVAVSIPCLAAEGYVLTLSCPSVASFPTSQHSSEKEREKENLIESITVPIQADRLQPNPHPINIVHPCALLTGRMPLTFSGPKTLLLPAPFFRIPAKSDYFYVIGQSFGPEEFCRYLLCGGFPLDGKGCFSVVAPSERYSLYPQTSSAPDILSGGSRGARRAARAFKVTINEVDPSVALQVMFLYHGGNTWITERIRDCVVAMRRCRDEDGANSGANTIVNATATNEGSNNNNNNNNNNIKKTKGDAEEEAEKRAKRKQLRALMESLDIELFNFELWTNDVGYTPSLSAREEAALRGDDEENGGKKDNDEDDEDDDEEDEEEEEQNRSGGDGAFSFKKPKEDCREALRKALPRREVAVEEPTLRALGVKETSTKTTPTTTTATWQLACIIGAVRIGSVLHDYSVATPYKAHHLSAGTYLTKVAAHVAKACGVVQYYYGVPIQYMDSLGPYGGRREGSGVFYHTWDAEVSKKGIFNVGTMQEVLKREGRYL